MVADCSRTHERAETNSAISENNSFGRLGPEPPICSCPLLPLAETVVPEGCGTCKKCLSALECQFPPTWLTAGKRRPSSRTFGWCALTCASSAGVRVDTTAPHPFHVHTAKRIPIRLRAEPLRRALSHREDYPSAVPCCRSQSRRSQTPPD